MPTLAERLKAETRSAHTTAERSRFMGALLKGRLDKAAYCVLLRNLHPIYATLEPALRRHAQHPALSPVVLDRLWRSRPLADDLDALHGPSWREAIGLQAATEDFVAHLHRLSDDHPPLLLAHAYVRYLGDLSGGQLLRRIVRNSMALPDDAGTAFYGFGDAEQTRQLTQDFRDGLDRVEVDAATEDRLVAEALLAFDLHQRLFEELAASCGV
jgi:heme oxygenase